MIRGSRCTAIAAATMVAVCIACTAVESKRYRPGQTNWTVFPTLGALVSETLNGLFDEGEANYKLSLREVVIFRTSTSPWQEVHLEDLPPPGVLSSGSYAIAAHRYCRAWAGESVTVGANEWYLFRDGRLAAYDSRTYHDGCRFTPVIELAPPELIDAEEHIRQWIAENSPAPTDPKLAHYIKGIAYADADRLDVAEQYLASGDAAAVAPSDALVVTRSLARSALPAEETLPREIDDVAARKILVLKIERLRRQPRIP